MAWARVDDQWFAHRKVVGLSLAARGLWTTVLSWSCAQRSPDVPSHMARFLAGGDDIDGLADELVTAGLWLEVEGGWEIHDWQEYQGKSLSEKRADAGAKGGRASGEARREASAKQPKQDDEAGSEAGTRPGPSRPDPALPDPTEQQLDEFGEIYPRRDRMKWGGTSRGQVAKSWQKLTDDQRQAALAGARHYAAYVQQPGAPTVAMATTWLNQQRWEQFQEPRHVDTQARASPPVNGTRHVDHFATTERF